MAAVATRRWMMRPILYCVVVQQSLPPHGEGCPGWFGPCRFRQVAKSRLVSDAIWRAQRVRSEGLVEAGASSGVCTLMKFAHRPSFVCGRVCLMMLKGIGDLHRRSKRHLLGWRPSTAVASDDLAARVVELVRIRVTQELSRPKGSRNWVHIHSWQRWLRGGRRILGRRQDCLDMCALCRAPDVRSGPKLGRWNYGSPLPARKGRRHCRAQQHDPATRPARLG